jgi:SAM-dependent methyltransferase
MEKNLRLYERFAHYYSDSNLEPAEWAVLKRFKTEWARMDMLDIGVGAGRTSHVFSAITRSYTGIDYARRALELCRDRIGETNSVRFILCDAREMSRRLDRQFDFIMFSMNGIDSVNHADRLRIFAEVRALLKEQGHFLFSSHSLAAPPRRLNLPGFDPLRPLRSTYKWGRECVRHFRFSRMNRAVFAAKAGEWVTIREELGGHALDIYYILPSRQLRQLEETGFRAISVYDLKGKPVDGHAPGQDLWLHYLCRHKETPVTDPCGDNGAPETVNRGR